MTNREYTIKTTEPYTGGTIFSRYFVDGEEMLEDRARETLQDPSKKVIGMITKAQEKILKQCPLIITLETKFKIDMEK